jgi:phosphate transport system substrate-binding protein
MRKVALMLFGILLSVFGVSDLEIFTKLNGKIDISGGTAHIKCEKEIIKKIIKKNPSIKITISGGGSGVGIKQVSEGVVDLANSGRIPTKKEIEKGNLKIYQFAIDGIAVAVNPNNKITDLTSKELRDIFSGNITNYKQLGYQDAPINLYIRDKSSATLKVFWKKALNKVDISKKARVVSSNAAMKSIINKDINGIGIISVGVADSSIKLTSIDNIYPSIENIKNGVYKISRGLYILSKGEPKPLAKAFIDYIRGKEGAKVVSKYGFIPVK